MINELGRVHHPNQPLQRPAGLIHLDDGRGFVRKTTSHYDLISYAVVDSLALHSSYSSVRLESFLFTEQAFRDIKAKLKPGGVFAMYNFYRQGWVVGRLVKLVEKVFGSPPIVVSLPYQEIISPGQQPARLHYVSPGWRRCVGGVAAIRSKFAADGFSGSIPTAVQLRRSTVSARCLRSCRAGRPRRSRKIGPAERRAGRTSTESRPMTGRFSTSARPRSRPSTCGAWRSWRCFRL